MSKELNDMESQKKVVSNVLIEVVGNGFVVIEDYPDNNDRGRAIHCEIPKRKVYNTKSQLYKYIKENL